MATTVVETPRIDLQWPDPSSLLRELTTRRWSPYSVPEATEPADRMGTEYDGEEDAGWAGTTFDSMSQRAAEVAWQLVAHDPNYAAQIATLSDGQIVSNDFAEFLMMLIKDAGQAGALYAKHVPFTESEMRLDRVVRAVGALMGVNVLADRDGAA